MIATPSAATGTELITDSPTGNASAIAVSADGTTYVGGSFTSVGANTGGGAAVDSTSGIVNRAFPGINGPVLASASDGAGGWYIGGSFTWANGVPRVGAARILADGTVDPQWNPNISGTVNTMAVNGSTVYLGGTFNGANSVNGTLTRNRAAAVDATTGVATAWDPNINDTVNAMAISGSTVYLGGTFTSVGPDGAATTRNRAAAVDSTTGTASAWNPNLNNTVNAIAVSGTTVYLGGTFNGANSVNGTLTRNRAAAVDATTGVATAWDPNINGAVNAMAIAGTTVFLGGGFTSIGPVGATTTRNYAAAIGTDGTLNPTWNPAPSLSVLTMSVSGTTVYMGGSFTSISGTVRNRAAAVSTSGVGAVQPWNPNVPAIVNSIAVSGSTAYLGGGFSHVNLVTRNRAAAFDGNGRVANWDPNLNGNVNALAVSGTTIYLGGAFTTVGPAGATTVRNRAAAFSAEGTLAAWDPNLSGNVNAIAISGTTAYLGGAFSGANSANGTLTRNRAAAVDTTTGVATAWDPNLSGAVNAIAISGTTAYLGGAFSGVNSVNGTLTRNRAAAVDTTTGTATAWDPNLNDAVNTVAVSGTTTYLGGIFTTVGPTGATTSRNRIAAVDASTGAAVSGWNANIGTTGSPNVRAILVSGSTVYFVGFFQSAGGTQRNSGAAVTTAGVLEGWNPSFSNSAFGLALGPSSIYAVTGSPGVANNLLTPRGGYLAKLSLSGANPAQPARAAVSGTTLTWDIMLYTGVQQYYVMYRQQGATYPWAIYATGVNNNGVALDNPGTRNICSATNTAMGYTSCPMVRGWTPGITYELAVIPRTTEGKNSLNPIKSLTTYTVPPR